MPLRAALFRKIHTKGETTMSLLVLQGAVEQGFIYALVALGLYISFRTLDIADLTTDGTFTLGAAVSAVFTVQGQPLLGVVLAFFCGALAGFVTALLQTKLGVQPILAGIITMTALYSVNLMVMGKPNINFFKEKTIFTAAEAMPGGFGSLLQAAAITAVLCVLLVLFLRTQLGLSLRATGDNRDMVSASSINPAFTTTVGLCLSNAVVALSGALIAQYQKFADNTLGTGMVVIGLASLIIGEVLFGRGEPHALAKGVLAATVGAVVYRIIVSAAIAVNIDAKNMKLVSALIVAAAISYPAIRDKVLFTENAGRRTAMSEMLELRHISKTFGAGTINEKKAVEDLSLTLASGDFVTIIGGNGAGKSTLFNAVAGVFYVDEGRVILDGEDMTFLPEYKRSNHLGRLFQDPLKGTAPHMTIEENLALAYLRSVRTRSPFGTVSKKDREYFRERLAALGLGLEDRLKSPVGLLSGGQRQALTLLMATLVTPKLLLLDEHTAALDPSTAEKVLELTRSIVAENNITCMMITHNIRSALELGNRTIMMDAGRIVLDLAGEERAGMTVDALLEKFRTSAGKALDNDRILLSDRE